MEKVSALEKKYNAIKEKLREQTTFYMEDVQAIFPEMKQSSIYWNLSKLVEAGYLKRVRTGVYTFNEWKELYNKYSGGKEKIKKTFAEKFMINVCVPIKRSKIGGVFMSLRAKVFKLNYWE